MIPTRLNLLSPEKRRVHQRTTYFQWIKNMLEVLFIVICLSSILLLVGLAFFQNQQSSVTSGMVISESKYVQKNREADVLNMTLNQTEKMQGEYVAWLPLLETITSAIPERVGIEELSIDTTKKTIVVTGIAPTRDDLLQLKDRFAALPNVKPFDIPIAQLIEKQNIPFSFTILMTP